MPGRHRTRRRAYKPWGRQANLELAITVAVLLVLVVSLVVFLFVYHDLPFRFS